MILPPNVHNYRYLKAAPLVQPNNAKNGDGYGEFTEVKHSQRTIGITPFTWLAHTVTPRMAFNSYPFNVPWGLGINKNNRRHVWYLSPASLRSWYEMNMALTYSIRSNSSTWPSKRILGAYTAHDSQTVGLGCPISFDLETLDPKAVVKQRPMHVCTTHQNP